MTHWRTTVRAHGIRPIHHCGSLPGKNSADIALAIDAMDLPHHNDIHTFIIVSSDADFTGLAIRLRESGCYVHGIGEHKTHATFAAACTTFTYLNHHPAHQKSTAHPRFEQPHIRHDSAAPPAGNPLDLPAQLVSALLNVVAVAAGPDGWANQATVGDRVAQQLPALDISHYGFTKFGKFIHATNLFDTEDRTPHKGKPPVVYLRPTITA